MFEQVDRTTKRIQRAEEVELAKINRSLGGNLAEIEKNISRNWQRIREQDLLPDEKTNALISRINFRENDYSNNLRELYNRVRAEAVGVSQQWISEQVAEFQSSDKLNDPIDFWSIDGNNRIGDWSKKFFDRVQAAIRLGYQSGWGKDQVLTAVRQTFGRLKYEVSRVVKTGSTGVTSGISERLAVSNDLELVVLKTSEDDRVCPYCASREGNVYRRGEISLPLHPECRCWFIPISKAQLRDDAFRKSLRATRKESLAVLAEKGGKPNKGVAPFEKGLKKAPRPVFNAERGFTWGERKRIFND